jgi:hypothetical protein
VKPETLDALVNFRDGNNFIGDFLGAVVRNDLRGAVSRADPENLAALRSIVLWVHNEIPCERLTAWKQWMQGEG